MLVRNLLLAALLLASPLSAQVVIDGMELSGLTVTAAADTAPAEDWTDSFIAVYKFEASGDPWANDENSTGGSGCDMKIGNGTPTRETGAGDYVEGVAGVLAEDAGGEDEYLNMLSNPSCEDLDDDLNDSSVSWGGWTKTPHDSFGGIFGYNTSSTGFQTRRASGTDAPTCRIGGVSQTVHTGDTDSFEINTWYHITCVYDHSGETIDDFVDGDASTVGATSHTDGLAARDYKLGDGTGAMDVYADEAFVYAGVLTEADTCRIAACGIDGALCTCNGTAWVDDGRHTTLSLTCTLPTNCNDASP